MLAALLTLLNACADGGQAITDLQPVATVSGPQSSSNQLDNSLLPALPEGRSAAGLTETSVNGDNTFSRSSSATPVSPVLQLASSTGELSWGIWELPAVDELRYLDIEMFVPEQSGSVYIALADYSKGTWDIQGPVFAGRVVELDPARHTSPGSAMYAAVLAHDGADATVQKLSLVAHHANAAPSAALVADVTSGTAPLTVEFDASGSSDPDGNIVRYLWDWDGNGGFDEQSISPVVTHIYTSGGSFSASVVVEDSDGERSTSTPVEISVNSAPLAVLTITTDEVQKGADVLLNGSLSSDVDGSIVKYEWDTDGNGSFESDSGAFSQITFAALTAGPFVIQLRVTDNNGATAIDSAVLNVRGWNTTTPEVSANFTGIFTSLAVVNGRPAISYHDQGNRDLRYVQALDAEGSVWGTPLTVDGAGFTGFYTSLAVVNGKPAIGYRDDTNDELRYVRATDTDGSAWGTPITLDNNVDSIVSALSLAVVNGNPAISYQDLTNLDLRFVRATNANGSAWNAPITLDSVGDTGRDCSLAVVNGNPAVSYFDTTNTSLRFVRATDASGTAWGTPLTLDSSGITGTYTSLAVVNGNPAISYRDGSNGYLRYIRAEDPDGGAWHTPLTLDDAGGTGLYTSLAIINGKPAISYHDLSNTNLRYIQAADAEGTIWDMPLTIDFVDNVGQYTSLVEVNGRPAISYHSNTEGDLRYAWGF
ncbi:PKD domain-containing protein [bacterium]|nr:PKD domain-containing protein [bacterium]